ncbi:hypothetical protein M8C82_16980 [Agrobacterium pusense]|uniref:hypothetical protein n=2 Tax=Agrobacterium pusense TaxID=648995 RepID=UPI000882FD05|nr:hypothetical protein [Agrobacterium pusense]WKD45095.1 hypothetical protein M8C82_16980 [Agrobacterium pusense]SDE61249.1 hypothetical protein SAMN05421750_102513 [Agrobacterium pusense]
MMFWKKREKSAITLKSEYELMREEREEMQKKKMKEDADAVQRSLSYEPPVRVVKGKYNDFLEVASPFGRKVCVPIHLISATSIRYVPASLRFYSPMNSPSDIASIIIEMSSGTKHDVSVEVSCVELLLESVNRVWQQPAAALASTGGEHHAE